VINLLSPADKRQLHAARRNTIWSRYTFLGIALFIAINTIVIGNAFLIVNQAKGYQTTITNNQGLSNQKYSGIKTKTNTFRKNLTTAKAVLDTEMSYSTVIASIGYNTPTGCVVGALTLGSQTFGTPQVFSFSCKATANIIPLKTALENAKIVTASTTTRAGSLVEDYTPTATNLFSQVVIVSASTVASGSQTSYPVSISISLVINKPPSVGVAS
jgi:hypothetical protein